MDSKWHCMHISICRSGARREGFTIAARTFGGHDRSLLGTTQGTIRVSDPLSVKVTGPALPAGQYHLVATVEIYPAGHSPEDPPLHSQGVSGDLMRVTDAPLGSAAAVA